MQNLIGVICLIGMIVGLVFGYPQFRVAQHHWKQIKGEAQMSSKPRFRVRLWPAYVTAAMCLCLGFSGVFLLVHHPKPTTFSTAPPDNQTAASEQVSPPRKAEASQLAPQKKVAIKMPKENPNQPHGIHGSDNTVVNDNRPIEGNGNTILGPTDQHGNAIYTTPGAIGRNAHAGPGSIAIGAGAGAGSQQTTNLAPITQSNSGGCNQQVIGGNNNTNNCVPPDRTLTNAQEDGLRAAVAQVPSNIEIVVSHSDNRDAQEFAQLILGVVNPIHPLSHDGGWIGGHWKGNKIAVHGTDDAAATPAQFLGFAVDHNGIPLAEPKAVLMDPKEVPAGKIYIFIGEQ